MDKQYISLNGLFSIRERKRKILLEFEMRAQAVCWYNNKHFFDDDQLACWRWNFQRFFLFVWLGAKLRVRKIFHCICQYRMQLVINKFTVILCFLSAQFFLLFSQLNTPSCCSKKVRLGKIINFNFIPPRTIFPFHFFFSLWPPRRWSPHSNSKKF